MNKHGRWRQRSGRAGRVPVAAHHALAAQYDMDKPIEITGTLKKMEFINPHSMLHLDVTNPDGTMTTWVFQTTNAGTLRNRGLARSGPGSLEAGANYTVKGYAARNGNPMGFLRVARLPGRKRDDVLVRRSERELAKGCR